MIRGKPFPKGNIPWNKGLKPSGEYRKQCILNLKNRFTGKSHTEKHKEYMRKLAIERGFGKDNKGRKFTEDHKKKISEARKRYFQTHQSWNKGVKFTEEHKRKIGEASKRTIEKRPELAFQKGNQINKGRISFRKGKKYPEMAKEKHHNWKGGITPLNKLIRNSQESKKWMQEVYKRDNFTCQRCGQVGRNLISHHIKQLSILMKEFLEHYNQFSPFEDKETLVRLAINYKAFWETDNGETLCEKCHKSIKPKRIKI